MIENKTISLESETGFRALFQFATVGILVVGSDGRIELANPCIERMFGYTNEELRSQPVEILIPHAFRTDHINHRKGYFTKPKARPMGYGLNLYALKKDGTEFPVEISLGHYRLDNENLAVAFVTDISERRKSEQLLSENKQKLDEEAAALKFLHEAGTRLWQIEDLQEGLEEILESAIKLTKADMGDVQFFNSEKQALEIVAHKGFSNEFLDYFKEVSAQDTSACGIALKKRTQIIVSDTDQEWTRDDAEIARRSGFRSVQSTPLLARDGTPIGMISTHYREKNKPDEHILSWIGLYAHKARSFIEKVRNHNTIKKQNQELEERVSQRTIELIKSLEREKQLNELKSRFVSIASHEFRTPLSAILSSISLVDSYSKEEHAEKRKKHIDRIKSSVKNLVDILNDFLSLDKLEQGKVDVLYEKFNLQSFTEDIIEEMGGILKNGQEIHLAYSGNNEVCADKKILKNIFLNLFSNAIKYSDEGKEIHCSIETKELVLIKIADSGIGIPESEQQNLFTKFFRAGNAVNIQGTGLGLNIVKKYVELLGGTIAFNSIFNEGTTFTISFPNKSIMDENHLADRR